MLDRHNIRFTLPRDTHARVMRPATNSTGEHRIPSVTVVIPCYNYGHYLGRCVQSVLDQEDVTVDVLVIDDASPDGSGEVAASLAARDSRIHVIRHAKNRGHIATYNEGLPRATGDYTVLLSADDMLTPGCLARAATLMDSHPQVGMVYGTSLIFNDNTVPSPRTSAKAWVIWEGSDWLAYRCRTGRNPIRSPEVVMRTRVLHKIGYYRHDLPHAADFELWMRASTVSGIGYVAGADQAYYRIHAGNMHQSSFDIVSDMEQRLLCFNTVLKERGDLLPDVTALRKLAHRTLAREALLRAIEKRASGSADEQNVTVYTDFASKTWPEYQRLSEWQVLGRTRGIQAQQAVSRTVLLTHRITKRIEYAISGHRRRLAGL